MKHTATLPKANVIGDQVRKIRMEQKILQQDLAARLQVRGVQLEQSAISRIESGNRFVLDYEVLAIASVLGVGLDKLYPVNWGNVVQKSPSA